jgi:hypothetical protein
MLEEDIHLFLDNLFNLTAHEVENAIRTMSKKHGMAYWDMVDRINRIDDIRNKV